MYTDQSEAVPGSDDPPRSRRDRVYAELKQRLLLGRVVLGGRLAEEHLAAEMGVSRTPVREALQRLHAEGLVEPHGDGGFRPKVPDMVGIRELYEVRLALETQALRRPGENGGLHDRDALDAIEARWMELALDPPAADPEFVLTDESFHVELAEAAGNAELSGVLRSVNERIRPVRMHDFLTPDRIRATIDQHLGIVRALRAESVGVAVARLTVHLTDSMAVVEARAEAALRRMRNPEPHDGARSAAGQ
jgi:DNA-binding GntR family transcriptional regulator